MSNICEICNGIKNLVYLVEAVPKSTAITSNADSIPASKSWGHLCYGHPLSTPRHDGHLDPDKERYMHATVEWYPYADPDAPRISISGGYEFEEMFLDPQQALSLLDWLRQEEVRLKALVKEQEE